MTFILRTWAYFCLFTLVPQSTPTPNKSMSLVASLALIVSSRSLVLTKSLSSICTPVVLLIVSSFLILTSSPGNAGKIVSSPSSSLQTSVVAGSEARNDKTSFSNITLLDLYPELKDYLWKKALSQMIIPTSTTTPKSALISFTEGQHSSSSYYPLSSYNSDYANTGQQEQYNNNNALQNGWGWDYTNNGYYGTDFSGAAVPGGGGGQVNNGGLPQLSSGSSSMGVGVGGNGVGQWMNSRESNPMLDSDSAQSSYNYQKEVLKHWHPFGSPEFYDSWKFKPSPPISSHSHHSPPVSSHGGWGSLFPFLEEEEESSHQVTHELTKDFSCLAGLLGLKTLKTLKFSVIFKKLKMFAIFFIAFKLGVLLSPVAIPLLFPIIILVTVVKVLPLILIIVLLLKILKKQVKIKKPFGKYLESTGSLFFDDVEYVTEKVVNSDDEYLDKLATGIQQQKRSKSLKDSIIDSTTVGTSSTSTSTPFKAKNNISNKRVNSRMLS